MTNKFVEPQKQKTNMGYISIQINKAKGAADTGASDYIERKTTPKNADPTRTHLNRELVQFPDGVADRTEAISHRIRTAGIRRKITKVCQKAHLLFLAQRPGFHKVGPWY